MIENQLMTFSETIEPHDCGMALPVVFGGNGITFFLPPMTAEEADDPGIETEIIICTADGVELARDTLQTFIQTYSINTPRYCAGILGDFDSIFIRENYKILPRSTVERLIAPDECFRIGVEYTDGDEYSRTLYSNILRRSLNTDKGLSYIEYGCNEEAFGLPFLRNNEASELIVPRGRCLNPLRMWMPIKAHKPNYGQKDSIYEKLNGERVVMYAAVTKEYECESDYIPDDWHRKMVIALSCDEVYVDGERLTKTDKYDINWNNVYKTDCGIKCAKATWKMAANVTQRNTMQ